MALSKTNFWEPPATERKEARRNRLKSGLGGTRTHNQRLKRALLYH